MHRFRGPAAAILALLLALTLSACGGSDADATDKPTVTASTSATPTPTPTPTPSPTAEPLSPFEDNPAVRALRGWFDAEAKAVNARERSLKSLAGLSTASGLDVARQFAGDDLAHGYYLPGPHPFTPVNVQSRKGTARVNTCFLLKGWSEDRKTHKPVRAREVFPIVWVVERQAGAWKVDNWSAGTADCAGVTVKKVRW